MIVPARPLDSGAASSAACRQGKKDIGRSRKKKKKKEKKGKKEEEDEDKDKDFINREMMQAIEVSFRMICILQF